MINYSKFKIHEINGRYITNETLLGLSFSNDFNILGFSVGSVPIYYLKLGSGSLNILIWSQMHGNESTSTRALFDLISFLKTYGKDYLNYVTFHIVPILNPDGALNYTRNNLNGIDLNRDFLNLSQPESRLLNNLYESVEPDFCFNLHDQKSIYSVEGTNNSSIISLLSPTVDNSKSVTSSRTKSMKVICSIYNELNKLIEGHVSRFNDDYNPNCVGEAFQTLGTPTILFESGQLGEDYTRENTREFMCISLIYAIKSIAGNEYENINHNNYFLIPENDKSFFDILIKNILLKSKLKTKRLDLGLRFEEDLCKKTKKIIFNPKIIKKGMLKSMNGHKEIDFVNNSNIFNLKSNNLAEFLKKI